MQSYLIPNESSVACPSWSDHYDCEESLIVGIHLYYGLDILDKDEVRAVQVKCRGKGKNESAVAHWVYSCTISSPNRLALQHTRKGAQSNKICEIRIDGLFAERATADAILL